MRLFRVVLLLLLTNEILAQDNGQVNFQILQTVSPARIAALGGNSIAVKDGDLNLGLFAPSLLDSSTSGQVVFGYTPFFGEANILHSGYAQHIDSVGTFSLSITSLGYGDFTMTSETGQVLGSFNAGEYLFQGGYGRQLNNKFSVGGNLKFMLSELADYKASGVALDLSGTFYSEEKLFTATVLIKNLGTSISSYREGLNENLPFEIQAAISKKLDKAPIRLSLIGENLQRWDLTPERTTTEIDPLTGEEIVTNPGGFGENLMRHLVFNSEILLTKNFNIRIGYNYNRRQQLKVEDRPGAAGITYGLGMRIAKIHISYARAAYSLAGVSNHLTLNIKFDDFKKS
ncbi:MAG: type IX secretion system protein PorQ [Flavobacteriales bacterium]|nr:type IX secretion system protein PorQ [Flavobacteriales bacterium]